jgi:hypothetical protein
MGHLPRTSSWANIVASFQDCFVGTRQAFISYATRDGE